MSAEIVRQDTGQTVGYVPSNFIVLVPDLTPVKVSRRPARPDRTCQARLADGELCAAVLGKNGATRRARTGQRFCSDECQRAGRRQERKTTTSDYIAMTGRMVARLPERVARDFDDLTELAAIAKAADAALHAAVTGIRARDDKVSWTMIGDLLGLTRQGAQQRFGKTR